MLVCLEGLLACSQTIADLSLVAFICAGLSPDLNDFDQIRSIARPTDVPDTGLLCDLLWSDPDKDMQGWGENDRGVSFTFGSDIVTKFLNRHDLDLICRAHQVSHSRRGDSCKSHTLLKLDVLPPFPV